MHRAARAIVAFQKLLEFPGALRALLTAPAAADLSRMRLLVGPDVVSGAGDVSHDSSSYEILNVTRCWNLSS